MKSKEKTVDLAIIGGTGYNFSLDNLEEIKVYTPYGSTSAAITIGDFKGKKVAYIPRHGSDHSIPPHRINFRANIWALKKLGAKFIISPSAVGSLRNTHRKGKFILVDQYLDRTKRRAETFYEGGQLCHIGQADPYCDYLNRLFFETGEELNFDIQIGGVYVCIEGPRFSTRAESKMFRGWGGDIVGMTNYPEVVLSAEKEICYCSIAMITDLDVWAGECSECGIVEFAKKCKKCGGTVNKLSVSVSEVLETMVKNAENLKKLLELTIQKIDIERDCTCHHSLTEALL
ncbi:MAG: MTAP family purine nucleoside phosphorylase [Candidatus Lokiarchaeota archaeon]|nr:MTAP family purine nucleoside phosphorylase [Candidatus Lokiarchaeota archaeon]